LKVINNSHSKGILRIENLDFENEKETICEVEKGGIMIRNLYCFMLQIKLQITKEEELFI
jgi:hypothetical protein